MPRLHNGMQHYGIYVCTDVKCVDAEVDESSCNVGASRPSRCHLSSWWANSPLKHYSYDRRNVTRGVTRAWSKTLNKYQGGSASVRSPHTSTSAICCTCCIAP
jgi:hypothetical protein